MIAAEELGLVDRPGERGAGRHERLALGVRGRELLDHDRDGRDEHARRGRGGADAAREHGLGAARRPGGEPDGRRTASSRAAARRVKYADLMAGKLVRQHDRRRRTPTLTEPEQLQADRDAGAADRHPGDRHRQDDLHPERARARDAPRPRRAPARAGGARPGRDAARASTRARSRTSRTCRSCRRATSSASSRRRSTTRSRRPPQLKVTWDDTPTLPGNGNLERRLRDPANLPERRRVAVNTGDVGAGFAGAAKMVSRELLHRLPGARRARPELLGRRRRRPNGATILCASQGPYLLHAQRRSRPRSALPADLGARRGLPRLGHLRPQHLRRRQHLRGAAVAGGRQAGAGAVHALGRARLGPVRPRPGDRRPRRHRRERQDRRLRLHRLQPRLDAGDRVGRRARRDAAPARRPGRKGRHDERRAPSTRSRTAGSRARASTATTGFLKGIWLRAPGAPQALFASEQTIDALAHAANMDPIAFRIQNIDATQTERRRAAGSRVLERGRQGRELEAEGVRLEARKRQRRQGPRRRDRRLRRTPSRRSSPTSP